MEASTVAPVHVDSPGLFCGFCGKKLDDNEQERNVCDRCNSKRPPYSRRLDKEGRQLVLDPFALVLARYDALTGHKLDVPPLLVDGVHKDINGFAFDLEKGLYLLVVRRNGAVVFKGQVKSTDEAREKLVELDARDFGIWSYAELFSREQF